MRIGTRGSALALAQARLVADRLGSDTELVTITTAGDRDRAAGPTTTAGIRDRAAGAITTAGDRDRAAGPTTTAGIRDRAAGDKGRWVSELELALLDERIDLAVHSAKDVPVELADGLELVAIPARADPRDAICGAGSLRELEPGARVGTSSIRRTAQIHALREDLEVVAVRGNVDTRLRKLASGEVDALVLALAGLQRLGRAAEAAGILDELVPAAGQGALALEARAGSLDPALLEPVRDEEAMTCVSAERALTAALEASCNTPVGAHAWRAEAGLLELRAWIGLPDGSAWLEDRILGDPAQVGALVAQRMRAAGAEELLREATRQVERAR